MDLKNTVIGIEFGSTRIKAVMTDTSFTPVASGDFEWENRLEDGIWTYHYDEVITGLQTCFSRLKEDVRRKYSTELSTTGAIGISAMMHGYIPTDRDWKTLVPFRTWRNTITGEAAEKLTQLFGFNIPQRWCIAHFYQAILNKEPHVKDIAHVETLAAYVHRLLTGENNIGIDDASGMFPIDSDRLDFNAGMAEKFLKLTGFDIRKVFPHVMVAGQVAGKLTQEGALLLDPTGTLKAGIPLCPPEGDAATGMAATDAVRINTGNVSAGTSDFAMIVTDRKLGVHREIDMVTTPSGAPVAMVHCNNCTTDINSWVNLFGEFADKAGLEIDRNRLFTLLYSISLEGKSNCGSLMSCNYYSGEGVTDFDGGMPLFIHRPDSPVTLADFMRTHMMSAMATLKIGMDILRSENVTIEKIMGHGGYFKTPVAGQTILSAAIGAPVSVMETAGEGGPYGMALLAAYMIWNKGDSLEDFLDHRVFSSSRTQTIMASEDEVRGFDEYIKDYKKILEVERKALEVLNA